jgi:hypothetical protein
MENTWVSANAESKMKWLWSLWKRRYVSKKNPFNCDVCVYKRENINIFCLYTKGEQVPLGRNIKAMGVNSILCLCNSNFSSWKPVSWDTVYPIMWDISCKASCWTWYRKESHPDKLRFITSEFVKSIKVVRRGKNLKISHQKTLIL